MRAKGALKAIAAEGSIQRAEFVLLTPSKESWTFSNCSRVSHMSMKVYIDASMLQMSINVSRLSMSTVIYASSSCSVIKMEEMEWQVEEI